MSAVSDSWFRWLVNSSTHYAIISTDLARRIVSWNSGAEQLFGYTKAEVLGREIDLTFTTPDILLERPRQEAERARALDAATDERWHVRKDGSRFWASGYMMPVRNDAGESVGYVKIMRDRTANWQAREALRLAEERARLVNRATNDVIWDWDLKRGRIEWSEAIYSHFGYTRDEFGTSIQTWFDHIHPEDRSGVTDRLTAAVKSADETWSDRYRFRRKDGAYSVFFDRGYIVRNARGEAQRMIGSLIDITADRRAEAALQDTRAKLADYARELEQRVEERTARLKENKESAEAFSYSVSHDLRAPLRTICGFSEILLEETVDAMSAEHRDLLDRIHRAAVRMDKLIVDLMSYSRVSRAELPLTRIDLAALVQSAIAELEAKKTGAVVTVAGELPAVVGHQSTLNQAVINLLANAYKFVAPDVTPRVRVHAERLGRDVRLWVEDNGIGVPTAQRDRIFTVFERLSAEPCYSGTGIGLAIVKRAVTRMGGQVGFASESGQGSRFWIQLPAAEK